MEYIEGFVRNITYVLLFSIVIEVISPNNDIRKYVKMVTGFIIILAIITPIYKAFGDIDLDSNILDIDFEIDERVNEKLNIDEVTRKDEEMMYKLYEEEIKARI